MVARPPATRAQPSDECPRPPVAMPSFCGCKAPECWASQHKGKASCPVQVRSGGLVCSKCQEAASHEAAAAGAAEADQSATLSQEVNGLTVSCPVSEDLASMIPRQRCSVKRPPPEELAFVHHFWLALDPETASADSAGAESAGVDFLVALGAPACWRLALASVSPQPQMLWVLRRHLHGVAEAVCQAKVPGVVNVMAVETLFPRGAGDLGSRLPWLRQQNVPPQWVKDAVSMWAVVQHGGWALDLDIVAIQPVPLWPVTPAGYCFCRHPRKTVGWFRHANDEVSLAVFAAPRGSEVAQLLGNKFWSAACQHARLVASGERERCDWNAPAGSATWRLWCQNQRSLSELVRSMDHLLDAVQDAMAFIPYPSWLRTWPPEVAALGGKAEVAQPPRRCIGGAPAPAAESPSAAAASSAAAPVARHRPRSAKSQAFAQKGVAAVAKTPRESGAISPKAHTTDIVVALDKFGYVLFEPREVARRAFAVNLWWRQWPPAQREAVMTWVSEVCTANRNSSVQACRQQLRFLCPYFDDYLYPGGAGMAYGLACTWLSRLTEAVDRCMQPRDGRLLAASLLQVCVEELHEDGWIEYGGTVSSQAGEALSSSVVKPMLAKRVASALGPAAAVDMQRMQACSFICRRCIWFSNACDKGIMSSCCAACELNLMHGVLCLVFCSETLRPGCGRPASLTLTLRRCLPGRSGLTSQRPSRPHRQSNEMCAWGALGHSPCSCSGAHSARSRLGHN